MNDFWIALLAFIAVFGATSVIIITAIWWMHKYRFGSKESKGEGKK